MKSTTDWRGVLEPATARVRDIANEVASKGEGRATVGVGASGDTTIAADKRAEDELLKAISATGPVKVLSEEAGESGDPNAELTAVIDPLDGSSNYSRGIPFYCTSVAIVEGSDLSGVVFGIVRDIVSGDVYVAERGKGATKNGEPINSSGTTDPSLAVAEVDLSRGGTAMMARVTPLLSKVKRQVHYGANALGICYVADGKVDAFVDLRAKMRVTDIAAAYLIAKEAGAVVSDDKGKELRPKLDLSDRFSYLVSATAELHEQLLQLCR